jgi:hypothetical protein
MSMPEHQIWKELENHFQTPIIEFERELIITVIKKTLGENPDLDLSHLSLKATEAVLRRRSNK